MRVRLALLILALVAAPLAAEAQQSEKVRRVGVLGQTALAATPGSETRAIFEAFRSGLRDLGWIENQNIVLESPVC
jgi:hypothetical protein